MSISREKDGKDSGTKSPKSGATLEEAIANTKSGKFHTWLLLSCGCCMIAMVGETFGSAFVSPAAQCEFKMGSTAKGLLNAISYIGMISSSHLWGYLADTKGRRKILIISLLLDVICSVLSSFAPVYWIFLILRFFNGFFMCAPSAVNYAYLGEFYSVENRTRPVLFMSVFLSIGGLYQKAIAWLIIPQNWTLQVPWIGINYSSWRVFVITGAIPSFIAMVLIYFLPESPKYLFSMGKNEEALKVLQYVYSVNTGRKPEEYPVSHVILDDKELEIAGKAKPTSTKEVLGNIWSQTKPLFQKSYLRITILGFIMQFTFFCCFNGFALWLPDLYNRLAQYRERHPGRSLTICQIMEALKPISSSVPVIQMLKNNSSFDRSLSSHSVVNLNNFTSYKEQINHSQSIVRNGTYLHNTCTSEVKSAVFRNIIVIRIVCIVVYSFAGLIVKYVKKKPFMAVCLLLAGSAGGGLFFAPTEWLIVALCATFISMSGSCVNLFNSIVIDSIPTHLRAMAVSLSMMCGRFGVMTCSLVMGALLERNCEAVFGMLTGIVLLCSMLTLVVPQPKKG